MAAPDFDPASFVASHDTIYIAAPAHQQTMVAPMVVGLIEDIRQATYDSSARTPAFTRPPVLLALDEVRNIAPLPELPEMISEGGGQGLVTLACLQDLSQARSRWPDRAEGLPSLFGTTVVLPGIGDTRTLEALSLLAGEEEVLSRTLSAGRTPTGHPVADLVTGGRPQRGESVSTQWRRRLPPISSLAGAPGTRWRSINGTGRHGFRSLRSTPANRGGDCAAPAAISNPSLPVDVRPDQRTDAQVVSHEPGIER